MQFGVALMSARDAPSRKWTSVVASADEADLTGIPGVTLAGRDLVDGVVDQAQARYRLLHLAMELHPLFDLAAEAAERKE